MYANCSICMPVCVLCYVYFCVLSVSTALDLGIVTDTSANLQTAIENALLR
jgi:hypothetical protein